MKNKCCNCQHENVCKYKEKYENTLNNIHELKIEKPFTIEINCFFYSPNVYLNTIHKEKNNDLLLCKS